MKEIKKEFILAIFILNSLWGICQIKGYPTIYSGYSCNDFKVYYEEIPDTILTNYWKVCHVLENDVYGQMEFSLSLCDSIIGSQIYKKMFVGESDTLLYRQEEDRVFMYKDGHEVLLLDYGLKEGDIFESAWGEKFLVTKCITCNPFYEYYGEWKKCISLYVKDDIPKILHLKSLDDNTREDEWMEGIGSVEWGIIPFQTYQQLGVFEKKPLRAHLMHGSTFGMYARFEVIEESYAKIPFEPLPCDYTVAYSFSGDTLCVKDVCELTYESCDAECLTKENVINLNVYSTAMTMSKVARSFILKIPGFKPRTYDIYLNGRLRRKALVCGDTDAINKIEDVEMVNSKWIDGKYYDLSGRQMVNGKFQKGIYIQDGKKVVME